MKTSWMLTLFLTAAGLGLLWATSTDGPRPGVSTRFEFATLRWDGPQNTHVIHPNGRVEVLGPQFAGIRKPDRTDERAFYMNLAANALGREGYELVALTPDEYLFRRTLKP